MPFAARKENGVWRLCKRAGDTITHVNAEIYPGVEIIFQSQAVTKSCADELNEHWKEYDRHETKKAGVPNPLFWTMINIIQKHKGLSSGDILRIKNG